MNKQPSVWMLVSLGTVAGLTLQALNSAHAQNDSPPLEAPALGTPPASNNVRALVDKGIYWYERYRFDLAAQQFNRVLLIDPRNASALRWQGLTDLARGEVQAAEIWLRRLQNLHGKTHPFAVELAQSLELGKDKRQRFAELRFLADSEQRPANFIEQLKQLFDTAPMGEVAVQVYRLMARTPEGRIQARAQVQQLIDRNPDDKRYRSLLAELGGKTNETQTSLARKATTTPKTTKPSTNTGSPKPAKATTLAKATAQNTNNPEASLNPEPTNPFAQGEALSRQAQSALAQQDLASTQGLLRQAIALNPAYPWFRYDLAIALDDSNTPENRQEARALMTEGMALNNSAEMHFAYALLLSRQGQDTEALQQMNQVPQQDWTEGMQALEKRIVYGQYLANLQADNAAGRYNSLARQLQTPNRWQQEAEIQAMRAALDLRTEASVAVAYEDASIDGSTGISKIKSEEIPIQINLPLDYERTAFIRLDTFTADAGQVDPANANNFAKLGTTATPGNVAQFLNQRYTGQVLGLGIEHDNWRWDLGTTTGNFPVNSWVGGLQWRTTLGPGSLRVDLARRMVTGSVLSASGATDPLTGERWGGARRNGLTAVYYQALKPTLDLVGIARANLITGRNIPDNTELNAQGILSKTIIQRAGQRLELGASLFLWSFDKNLRFYTFGQGGYYSPQAFASFTLPLTWTGKTERWSWRVQTSVGASESREDRSNLYPLNPELATAAAALGNSTEDSGGPGGGTSLGLRLQIEHLLAANLTVGGFVELDRSEGFNPDRLQLYLKYRFGPSIKLNSPPEVLTPYSRF